jgi:hypothetical protein
VKIAIEQAIAVFSILDSWDRAGGAVSVDNGWPPAELLERSGERPIVLDWNGERAGVYGWRRGSSILFT